MPALWGEEEVKLELEEIIANRIKWNARKRKNTGTELKCFNSKQIIN